MDLSSGDYSATTIEDVPDEVLFDIFIKFSFAQRIRIERVSKRWLHLSQQTWLDCPCIDDSLFEALATNADSAKPNCKPIKPEVISSHVRRCGKLLSSFSSAGHRFHSLNLKFDVLKNLADFCPNLQSVDLTNVELRFSFFLDYFAQRAKNLLHFTCDNLTRNLESGLLLILENCEELHWLRLRSTNITGSCFAKLSKKLAHLLYLDLSYCNLSEAVLSSIGEFFPNLAELVLDYGQRCPVPPMQWINNMLVQLVKLQRLTIGYADYEFGTDKLSLGHLSELTELNLQGSWCVNDQMLLSLTTCTNLTRLAIGGRAEEGPFYQYNLMHGLTDEGFSYLSLLPNLKCLIMTWMLEVSDFAIIQIAKRRILEEVWLNFCSNITNECFDSLSSLCTNLSCLNVSGCFVDDFSIFKRNAHLRSKTLRLFAYGIDFDFEFIDIVHPLIEFYWDGRPDYEV